MQFDLSGKKVGDTFVLSFANPRKGGMRSTVKVNDRFCIPGSAIAEVYPGETWLVELVGTNPKETFNLVKPIRIVTSEHGAHHAMRKFEVKFSDRIRFVEIHLSRQAKKYGAGSFHYAMSITYIVGVVTAKEPDLVPTKYVRDLLVDAVALFKNNIDDSKHELLPTLARLGELDLRLGFFPSAERRFKQMAKVAVLAKDNTYLDLANVSLARIYFSQQKFQKAAGSYRSVSRESDLPKLDRGRYARCLVEIGCHELACGVYGRLVNELGSTGMLDH